MVEIALEVFEGDSNEVNTFSAPQGREPRRISARRALRRQMLARAPVDLPSPPISRSATPYGSTTDVLTASIEEPEPAPSVVSRGGGLPLDASPSPEPPGTRSPAGFVSEPEEPTPPGTPSRLKIVSIYSATAPADAGGAPLARAGGDTPPRRPPPPAASDVASPVSLLRASNNFSEDGYADEVEIPDSPGPLDESPRVLSVTPKRDPPASATPPSTKHAPPGPGTPPKMIPFVVDEEYDSATLSCTTLFPSLFALSSSKDGAGW